ncbi:hypothetical protein PR048_022706 [Dryococelus australis]|uniref:Uncharacterized protein n=1 Tax=Dryococelus australis TaxID=614101 RepID=A0ABQ9GS01_9NEOP|nr:hypothetical protein PR048_022706 [Dryococelus australis]
MFWSIVLASLSDSRGAGNLPDLDRRDCLGRDGPPSRRFLKVWAIVRPWAIDDERVEQRVAKEVTSRSNICGLRAPVQGRTSLGEGDRRRRDSQVVRQYDSCHWSILPQSRQPTRYNQITVQRFVITHFHVSEPSSNPRFLHVGIVPDDAAGRRVISGISRFPRLYILALLHTHHASLKNSMLRGLCRCSSKVKKRERNTGEINTHA